MSALVREQWARRIAGRQWPLPTAGMFSRGKPTLDPRVFDSTNDMLPEVRLGVIGLLDEFWRPKYGEWQEWAAVYYAGSGASYWWDSDRDLDVLIGIDKNALDAARPQNIAVTETEVCAHLDRELKDVLDPTTTTWMGFTTTFYVNPGSYDIRNIKPYAAYQVSAGTWAVPPFKPPADWGPQSFPEEWWRRAEALANHITDLMDEPEPGRTYEGVALFDALHAGRQRAYSPQGDGLVDWGNVIWQVLSAWGVLQDLYHLKHPELVVA